MEKDNGNQHVPPWVGSPSEEDGDAAPVQASHLENVQGALRSAHDVDVAMALFDHPDQIHEPRDPEEERRLVRKIDFMILPYLAVCYAFFYIDKTTLSYAGTSFNSPKREPSQQLIQSSQSYIRHSKGSGFSGHGL
jgi:hypothetical protein